jgi:hypothetical protein
MTQSKRILLSLAAIYAIGGIVLALLPNTLKAERTMNLVMGMATMVIIYIWCRQDGYAINSQKVARWPLWAAIFPLICLPIYFLRTRSTRAALISTGKAVAYYIGITLLSIITSIATALLRGI